MLSSLRQFIVVIAALLAAVIPVSAASVHLSVTTPRGQRNIGVGDVFYIQYEVSNTDARPEQPRSLPGAKVMYFEHTGQSSSYTVVNGVSSQSRGHTYTLTARATSEGTFTFGPVTVGGVKSNQVKYIIGKASDSNRIPGGGVSSSAHDTPDSSKPKFIGKGDGNLFLRASVSKTTAYEQEALVYTVKLYTTYDGIKFIGATSAPKFEGFVVEESKATSVQLSYENYQGKTYATAIIARYVIFPQMKGTLKVIGNTYTCSVDRREYYHDPFWGNMSVSSPMQLNVTPNDLQVNVRPLPQPQPADFSGGVGSFSISSALPSSRLLTNQGASIVYKVSGTGNIKYIKLPDLNALFPSEIEVYSPQTDVKADVGASNVSGTATFDYTMTPLEQGTFKIPPVSLCYFNPATGKYERAVARGYTVEVGKGNASSKSQTLNRLRFDSQLMEMTDDLSADHTPMIRRVTYWMWYGIAAILLLVAIAIWRKHLKDLADIESMKSRRAAKIARRRLRKASDCMKRNDTGHFYDEMLRALWGYLAHKLRMPTSELTRDNILGRLKAVDVPQALIDKTLGLLDDCEYAKYAPSAPGLNMTDLYNQAEILILELERTFRYKGTQASVPAADHELTLTEKLDRELNSSKELSKDVTEAHKDTDPQGTSLAQNPEVSEAEHKETSGVATSEPKDTETDNHNH